MDLSADQRAQRRTTFNEVAEAYEAARPGYPPQLFDDLVAEIEGEHEIVEIGCGTGQATRPLLERGCRVTAVEIGAQMAAVAAERLRDFAGAFRVIRSSFEDSRLPDHSADAVVAATSFHWIEPDLALRRSARLLRHRGVLAVWRIVDAEVPPGEPDFIARSQHVYRELGLSTADGHVHFGPGARPPEYVQQIRDSPLFTGAAVRRYPSNQSLTTDTYIAQRRTHSDILSMQPELREELLSRLAQLIDDEFGGSFTRYAETVLCAARASSSAS